MTKTAQKKSRKTALFSAYKKGENRAGGKGLLCAEGMVIRSRPPMLFFYLEMFVSLPHTFQVIANISSCVV